MVRSTFLGASPQPRSEVKKTEFGTIETTPISSLKKNMPLIVTPETPDSPLREKEGGGASTSTAATSSTDAMNSQQPQQPQHSDYANISSNDKLSVMRDGPEATIVKLRKMIDESSQRDATAKAALAKSDAVILELRSSVRQLKRELERVQSENQDLQQQSSHESSILEQRHASEISSLKSQLAQKDGDHAREEYVGELQVQLDRAHAQIITADMVRKELEDTLEAEQYTWELRVQDQDRTIASLQQECQTLQQDLDQCRSQWEEAEEGWSAQLKELSQELDATKRELNHAHHPSEDVQQLKQTVATLERDRTELQSCLDEAMQELEAVDAEIQGAQVWRTERDELIEENERLQSMLGGNVDATSVKHLQQLVQWLQERPIDGDQQQRQAPQNENDPESLVSFVQEHVEALHQQLASAEVGSDLAEAREKVEELEAQLSVFRGDLKAREESSAELRTSLKEAVALLKPLQEVVDKTEREKEELHQELECLQKELDEGSQNAAMLEELQAIKEELEAKDEEVKRLHAEVASLEKQLDEQRSKTANPGLGIGIASFASRSFQPSNEEGTEEQRHIETSAKLEKAREDLRAKRASERALKQMLKNAQSTFNQLNQQNEEVANENQLLQEKLEETSKQLKDRSYEIPATPEADKSQETIQRLEHDIKSYAEEVEAKDEELARLSEEVEKLREAAEVKETEDRWDHAHQVEELQAELSKTKADLKSRKEAERVLGSSLKEALSLLHPLQEHLETAEREKKKLTRELKASQRRISRLENGDDTFSRSETASNVSRSFQLPSDVNRTSQDLEKLVAQLEEENSRLQEALEEISLNLSMSADEVAQLDSQSQHKLKENFVELKSRYEVTRQRLENANVQKSTLLENLKEKELSEREMMEEMEILRGKLRKSNEELENAKYIATSALVKVEEMTMAAVEKEMKDLSAETSQMSKAVVEKEIRDLTRESGSPTRMRMGSPTRMRGALSPVKEESEEVRSLRLKVEALQREVRSTKNVNATLEETVRAKDRRLKRFMETQQRASPRQISSNDDWEELSEDWGFIPNNRSR